MATAITPNPVAPSGLSLPEPGTPAPLGPPPIPPLDFPYGGAADPPPPTMSEQTAETMGKTRGRDRIAELLPVIDFLDATVRYRVQAIESGRKPSEHFPDLNAARCQRRVYA